MKVKTSELKLIIKEAISNIINNPLQGLENKVEETSAEIRNEIESLTNKLSLLDKIIPSVQKIYDEISNRMPIIKTEYKYDRLDLVLSQAIPFNENIEDFVGEMNNYIDDMLNDAIMIDYVFQDNGKNGIVTGFYIDIDLDEIQGWY